MPGKGSTEGNHSYHFIDDRLLGGDNYYRLKQIDFDGTPSFSNIIKLHKTSFEGNILTVFPNPTSGELNFFLLDGSKIEEVLIYDMLGKLVLHSASTDVSTLSLDSYAAGVYILIAKSPSGVFQEQIVVE